MRTHQVTRLSCFIWLYSDARCLDCVQISDHDDWGMNKSQISIALRCFIRVDIKFFIRATSHRKFYLNMFILYCTDLRAHYLLSQSSADRQIFSCLFQEGKCRFLWLCPHQFCSCTVLPQETEKVNAIVKHKQCDRLMANLYRLCNDVTVGSANLPIPEFAVRTDDFAWKVT